MENDLAEIKERQDLLEAHLESLEARIDMQEVTLQIVGARMAPAAWSSPPQAPEGEADANNARPAMRDMESLLRSIASKQGLHSSTLRILSRSQESWQLSLRGSVDAAVSKLDSIMESLRRVERRGTGA